MTAEFLRVQEPEHPLPRAPREGRSHLVGRVLLALGLGVSLGLPAQAEARPLFTDVAPEAGIDFVHFNGMSGELYFAEMTGAGAALLDYDGDGDLDVYLLQGHMLGKDKSVDDAVFPPAHPLPLTDRLYRNDLALSPDGTPVLRFVDVTAAAGLAAHGYAMGVAVGDFNNDGFPDLYLTNFGPNQMLRNNGDGTFTDVTAETGIDDPRWSVPAVFFDFDRDGWLDLYVGNYVDFRIATHKPCASETGAFDYCGPQAYRPETDRLFRNRGDGTFEDVSGLSGIAGEPGAALGAVAGDFNGDGWLDLYVANDGMPNFLWINQGDGTFVNEAVLGGAAVNELGQPEASMGVAAADLDGDGTEDLFMTHLTRETNTVYFNDGRALFRDGTRGSGLGLPSWEFTGFGVGLLDYDHDGWLDLFVANGAVKRIEELARQGDPYPLDQGNQLFRNLGNGRFQEVTREAGPVLELVEVSRGVAMGDVDHDGDADLLLANNSGPARLLRNEIGQDRPWVGVRALGRESPRDMLGAWVGVFRQGAPPLWRRVRTDGSYASASDPRVLVGLGDSPRVEKVRIHWPRGQVQEWRDLPANQFFTLVEGEGTQAP